MGFLTGKRALIFGVASDRSIAWGIAKAMHREGADLAFAYMGERLKERVEKLAGECDSDIVVPCDVEDDEQIEAVFEHLDDYWDSLDIIVHSVAFAPKEMLEGAADCLKVMAHPVRLRIVNVLMQGEFAVHEIADLCETSPNQTCEHLRLLKGHSLLSSERRGKTVYYKITSPRLPGLLNCITKSCK